MTHSSPRFRVVLLSLVLTFAAWGQSGIAAAADRVIYDEALASGWSDWSWDATRSFTATTAAHLGSRSIAVTLAGWGALYLHPDTPVSTGSYTSLRFWIHGGTAGNQQLQVVANGSGSGVPITAQAGTWTQVIVPLASLGSFSSLTDLYWQGTVADAQPTFYLDDIVLVASEPPGPGPALRVDASAARHPISDDVYGMNGWDEDESFATELRLPVRRRGGNATSRYNWQNDTSNRGSDWFFENIPDVSANAANLPDGSSADRFVEQDRRTSTRSLLTAPLIGWVPKRRPAGHPYDCGFAVSKYGAQQATDPWDTNCGNGVRTNGTTITDVDPTDTSIQVGPSFVANWVSRLAAKYGQASAGGVAFWNLDNEPMLWNSTHRDVHPQPVTYDELRDRTVTYAAAIKAADPSARTLGPVLWGWCAYFFSAADNCRAGDDYRAHGNTFLVPWYLQQLQAHETQHGVRLLDYLDLHFYPQAAAVALSPAGASETQALRLRSTRALWDPTYVDESWISDMEAGGVAVRLIRRMKEWVTANYPGTRTAITEYNWGALDHINGALAQADVLWIFGR